MARGARDCWNFQLLTAGVPFKNLSFQVKGLPELPWTAGVSRDCQSWRRLPELPETARVAKDLPSCSPIGTTGWLPARTWYVWSSRIYTRFSHGEKISKNLQLILGQFSHLTRVQMLAIFNFTSDRLNWVWILFALDIRKFVRLPYISFWMLRKQNSSCKDDIVDDSKKWKDGRKRPVVYSNRMWAMPPAEELTLGQFILLLLFHLH